LSKSTHHLHKSTQAILSLRKSKISIPVHKDEQLTALTYHPKSGINTLLFLKMTQDF